ncbi:kinase-like protein, partial [Aureobasidium melanogenum]
QRFETLFYKKSMASPDKSLHLNMPMMPPPMHSRAGSDLGERPLTPTSPRHQNQNHNAQPFISPAQTPQGSPSKNRMPPGAFDLPDVFSNAMKLLPTLGSPSKTPRNQDHSPTRKSNKENTPPTRPGAQQQDHVSQAAASRQSQYRQDEQPLSRQRSVISGGLTQEEIEKLQKPTVKRLANVTQLYFLDHYYDLLNYVSTRQKRTELFHAHNPLPPQTPNDEYQSNMQQYLGRERAKLRARRTRLNHGDFAILTQVGQGGYGQVYLAQKKDTREVCALKVMSKKLLFKLDEVRHVLTERDILTTAKSDWLVRLLYAFQDEASIYLAMEYVPGGDFRTLLNNTGVLHNRHAR